MIIKPYLTYRNAFIIAAEQLQLVEPILRRLLRLMRVNSAGGVDERVFLRQLKARVRCGDVARAVYNAANPLIWQQSDKAVSVLVKGFAVVMGVAVKDVIHFI